MNAFVLAMLGLSGGVFLAIQSGFNSQLGVLLKNPIIAVAATSLFSFLFALSFLLVQYRPVNGEELKSVPWFLWFIGAGFSMLGISIYFYLIPKVGMAKMVTLGLCGQLLFAVVSGHFGWFGMPKEAFTTVRILGAMCLLLGIVLINHK